MSIVGHELGFVYPSEIYYSVNYFRMHVDITDRTTIDRFDLIAQSRQISKINIWKRRR